MTKEELRANVGRNIQKERLARGLSAEGLAKLIPCSTALINEIESGTRSAALHCLLKLATVLDVSIDYLFSDEQSAV